VRSTSAAKIAGIAVITGRKHGANRAVFVSFVDVSILFSYFASRDPLPILADSLIKMASET
jgi:hypothetical protein